MFYDNIPFRWNDGESGSVSSGNTNGVASDSKFSLNVHAGEEEQTLVLYVGGFKSVGRILVYDKSGNASSLTFGNINGKFNQRVVINLKSETNDELYIEYSKLNGDNITLSAAAIVDEYDIDLEQVVDVDVLVNDTKDETNLTSLGSLDWLHNKHNDNNGVIRKNIDKEKQIIMDPLYSVSTNFYDYASLIKYTDGDISQSSGSRDGVATVQSFQVFINITDEVEQIFINLGAWRASNRVVIKDENGYLLYDEIVATGGNVSDTKEIVITPSLLKDSEAFIIVEISKVSTGQPEGNVSLVSVAASIKESVIVTFDPKNDELPFEYPIEFDTKVSKPEDPVKDGYIFDEWLLNGVSFDFNTNITNSITLEASYIKSGINSYDTYNNSKTTNLTYIADLDWVYSQHGGENGQIRKNLSEEDILINPITYTQKQDFYDYGTYIHYNDGNYRSERNFRDGVASVELITVKVKITSDVKYIRLYIGTWENTNVIKLYDEFGNLHLKKNALTAGSSSQSTVVLLEIDESLHGQIITITSERENLDHGNISLVAVGLSSKLNNNPTINIDAELTDTDEQVNLDDNLDWIHQGYQEADKVNRKDGVNLINVPISYDEKHGFGDYKEFSWTTGTPDNEVNTHDGAQSRLGFSFEINASPLNQQIEIFTGGWNTTNYITITDEYGNILDEFEMIAGDNSIQKKLTINFNSIEDGAKLIVNLIATERNEGAGGNISLVAITLN